MPFDPLEDLANSSAGESAGEHSSEESSNANSVSDEDSDWCDRAKQARIDKMTSPSINVTHPLPAKIAFEDIPVLFQDSEEATIVDRWFVVECRSVPMPNVDDWGHGSTPIVERIEVWKRGE
jgi:hypothetical protein